MLTKTKTKTKTKNKASRWQALALAALLLAGGSIAVPQAADADYESSKHCSFGVSVCKLHYQVQKTRHSYRTVTISRTFGWAFEDRYWVFDLTRNKTLCYGKFNKYGQALCKIPNRNAKISVEVDKRPALTLTVAIRVY